MAVGRKQRCDQFGLIVILAMGAALVFTFDCATQQVVPDATLPQSLAVTVKSVSLHLIAKSSTNHPCYWLGVQRQR
ncbi:hypothetical protein [Iningainema tapete]|uniref:Uncharacterized protein n=1 Tax=Iningainema tapete BLCC-T55 TaxID=2748662 RepID=A0A8J6XGD2_9CYAN|nr:hypothetical protein [Iningainema tapete]MBD2772675.1 hypothetical protein [Iningainema tapete BLCC-T55]